MIDVDAFLERCAILEFEAGLSRYQAECSAARMQDCSRWEAMQAVADSERGSPESQRGSPEGRSQFFGDSPTQDASGASSASLRGSGDVVTGHPNADSK